VTVGASLPFDRLIKYVDKNIAPNISEKIIAQIHDSAEYIPENMEYVKTVGKEKFDEFIEESDLVITHAGMGVIIDCISSNKKFILVPRDPEKGELLDSHQYEICNYLKEKYEDIRVVTNLENLSNHITNTLEKENNLIDSQKNLSKLKQNISNYLDKFKEGIIFIVCSSGGHLRQVFELIDIFPKERIVLITNTTKTELDGIITYKIKGDFTDNLLKYRAISYALYLSLKFKPTLIFTNGGGELSVPFAYAGKLVGSDVLFMETISRVTSKSAAAKLVYPIADRFLVQWKSNLKKYGSKAEYWGSVI